MSDLNGDAGRHSSAHDHARAWGTRRLRFWIESSVAGTSLLLALLTLVWRGWVGGVFGGEPPKHPRGVGWLIRRVPLVVGGGGGGVGGFCWGARVPAAAAEPCRAAR